MSLRRETLERMGGFDEALDVGSMARGGGDLDIMARAIRDGGTLVVMICNGGLMVTLNVLVTLAPAAS